MSFFGRLHPGLAARGTAIGLLGLCVVAAAEVRPPAVQGQFYPGTKAALQAEVARCYRDCVRPQLPGTVRALVSPHAGYAYSGVVAAAGYRHVDPGVTRVVILAPSHHAFLLNSSILDVDAYQNCLGRIPLAPAAARLRQRYPFITSTPAAHQREHSLEVQLPFLQQRLRSFTLIPIILGQQDPAQLADALVPLMTDGTLLVASSDLSHDETYDAASAMDHALVENVIGLHVDAVAAGAACGKLPILTLMHIARRLHWRGVVVDCRNSGDTTGNRAGRIVGYASIAFTGAAAPTEAAQSDAVSVAERASAGEPTPAAKVFMLRVARASIAAAMSGRRLQLSPPADAPLLAANGACFVTLTIDGRLRGCIGSLSARRPLLDDVRAHAVNAAFHDPRFPPLSQDEFNRVRIEISILTEPQPLPVNNANELLAKLRPGVDGVILSDGRHRSTYLPQVWEQLPGKAEFLSRLCVKGGMPADRWRQPGLRVQVYRAIKFREPPVAVQPGE